MGRITKEIIVSNATQIIPNAILYEVGILISNERNWISGKTNGIV